MLQHPLTVWVYQATNSPGERRPHLSKKSQVVELASREVVVPTAQVAQWIYEHVWLAPVPPAIWYRGLRLVSSLIQLSPILV